MTDSAQQLGFGLDLDPPTGIEETLDHDHGRSRIDVAEALAVSTADAFPVSGIDNVDSRSHDVLPSPTEGFDRLDDDLEAAGCLRISVTLHGLTLVIDRRGAGNRDPRASTNGARKPDQAFVCRRGIEPAGGGGIVILFHLASLYPGEIPGQGASADHRLWSF